MFNKILIIPEVHRPLTTILNIAAKKASNLTNTVLTDLLPADERDIPKFYG